MKGSKEPTGHFVATANKILAAEHRRSLMSLEKKKKKCLVLRWFSLENHQKACNLSLSFFFFYIIHFIFILSSFQAHLCVCIRNAVIHQDKNQNGDGNAKVTNDPSGLVIGMKEAR